jgi:hypothetical protein
MSDSTSYEKGYRDGLAHRTTDDDERVPGAHNAGDLRRADIGKMTAAEINQNWTEVQQVLAQGSDHE